MAHATRPSSDPQYRERLYVSPAVWIGTLVITVVVALQLALVLPIPMWVTIGGLLLLVGFALATAGMVQIRVIDGALVAGTERISCSEIARVEELDGRNTRAALGPAADPAATVITRPWVSTSVKVFGVSDEPPYLLVSTRHPEKLTAALIACANQAAVQ